MVTAPAHDAAAIAEIAKGLTKAQRTALWNLGNDHPDDFHNGWKRAPHDGWRRAGQACCGLCGKDLAERTVGDLGPMYRLTPLGLAVRARISQAKGE